MAFYFKPWVRTQKLYLHGRIDFSGATIAAANTDGGLIKAGTSSVRMVSDVANMKFLSFYFDNGATSGDSRSMYLRLYITGAGGGGESFRAFTDVEDVAAATARGAHISLKFGTTGSITGLGASFNNTLHIPAAMTGGTYVGHKNEIWADAAASDLSGATLAALTQIALGGNATGVSNIDVTTTRFIDFAGFTAGSGAIIDSDITALTGKAGLAVSVDGVLYGYIPIVTGS